MKAVSTLLALALPALTLSICCQCARAQTPEAKTQGTPAQAFPQTTTQTPSGQPTYPSTSYSQNLLPGVDDPSKENLLPIKSTPLTFPVAADEKIPALMHDLPLTPEQVQDGRITGPNPINGPGSGPLSGQASKSYLKGWAQYLPANPMTRYRGPKLVFVQVHLHNMGEEAIVIAGQRVTGLTKDGAPINPLTRELAISLDNSIISTQGKLAVAAVSAASLGLAGPIFYEMITPQENRKRSMGTAIGRDAGRHEIEEGRFSRRVILPADDTSGWIAFPAESAQNLASISVPVLLPPYSSRGGLVTIPITNPAPNINPVPNKTQNNTKDKEH